MSSLTKAAAAAAFLGLTLSGTTHAAVISFTGGTVHFNGGGTSTTNNSAVHQSVSYYEEQGFKIEFVGASSSSPFSSIIGNYYGASNDVIHGHWATGNYGALTQIKITKLDGTAFDMNYFILTSNTDTGGGTASGNERAFITASSDGVTADYSQLLPVENWGFPASQVFLGAQFDAVKAVWFTAEDAIDCFGMDNFYINQAAPNQTPEPMSLALSLLALSGMGSAMRRRPIKSMSEASCD